MRDALADHPTAPVFVVWSLRSPQAELASALISAPAKVAHAVPIKV